MGKNIINLCGISGPGSESEEDADITRSVAEGLKKFRQDHEEAERRRNEIRRRYCLLVQSTTTLVEKIAESVLKFSLIIVTLLSALCARLIFKSLMLLTLGFNEPLI